MNINRYARTYIPLFLALCTVTFVAGQVRSIDGYGNNEFHPEWGTAGAEIRHLTPLSYKDGIGQPSGEDRPNPRTISNTLLTQIGEIYDNHNLTDYTWVFGQFIDHDITLFRNSQTESAFISVPSCDPIFDPMCTGASLIPMMRNEPMPGSGTDVENPRSFANQITAYIDGSAIYGSDIERAEWLRSHVDGKLKVSTGDLLPFNTVNGEINGPTDPRAPHMEMEGMGLKKYFVAGDVRANENVMLAAMHTLFVREHNRICDELKINYPGSTDEQLYQRARKMVGGILQNIVYSEWLPSMGVLMDEYSGYRPDVNPNVSNVFSVAAFRFGHTILSSNLLRMYDDCESVPQGNISLRNAFFNPELLVMSGIDPLIKGLSAQVQQMLDCKIIDDVRNFLFGPPGMGFGFDLAAMNINRGRERGLGDYNSIRSHLGLGEVRSFDDIGIDPSEAQTMRELYLSVDDIDPWVGMLAERHMPGAMFGETIMHLMKEQFVALRDGDRFYFENDPELTSEEKQMIRETGLAKVVKENSNLEAMQENVFVKDIQCHKIEVEQKHLALSVFPNPVRENLSVNIYTFSQGDAELRITDPLGKQVQTFDLNLEFGVNTVSLNINNALVPGFYHLHLHMGEEFTVKKILKVN